MTRLMVSADLFEKFPTYRRGVVAACRLNSPERSSELEDELRHAVRTEQAHPTDLHADTRVVLWDEAHRGLGSNPNKYLPAHRALLKRVQRPDDALPYVNTIVAIMNVTSIEFVVPVGGDDADRLGPNLELRPATGTETFVALGNPSSAIERPVPGEVVYACSSGVVMCRRWNWRNSAVTKIDARTNAVVMNVDALGPDSEALVLDAKASLVRRLRRYCNATITTDAVLSASNPVMEVETTGPPLLDIKLRLGGTQGW